ncbi:unnamed protein product [Chondrus crispus]|uniref:Uncharacterized protein n=1 Tax=Chondrus crispus TaxID=2769 RepID=R7QPS9_CHOCR|nr:unnamed protein product [Chondrus crispus]CDF39405.1 unnamed protein product [Chondrus crispus]|eukprot:XP_005719316.1 unnamed protein product [Chondrus crispus]
MCKDFIKTSSCAVRTTTSSASNTARQTSADLRSTAVLSPAQRPSPTSRPDSSNASHSRRLPRLTLGYPRCALRNRHRLPLFLCLAFPLGVLYLDLLPLGLERNQNNCSERRNPDDHPEVRLEVGLVGVVQRL